jgi:drug/metabolite transporter (DMT)-like permease
VPFIRVIDQYEITLMIARSVFSNAYLLLVLAPLFWGGNAVAGKLAVQDWQPFILTNFRWFIATLLLLPFAWRPLQRDWSLIRRTWWIIFLLGAVGMCLFNLAMFTALNHTSAINVSIEQAAMPILIMLANFLFLSQRVRWLQVVGLLLSIVGVMVTTSAGKPLQLFSVGLNRGDAIMLLACVFYAGYTFGLRWRPAVHWLSFMWLISLSAFLMSLPFAIWEMQQSVLPIQIPGTNGWLVLLYVVIFPTMVSQLAYARGVELIGGNRAGLFINLVPIFGSLLAVLVLSEAFHLYHLLGLVLVVGGILLAERAAVAKGK